MRLPLEGVFMGQHPRIGKASSSDLRPAADVAVRSLRWTAGSHAHVSCAACFVAVASLRRPVTVPVFSGWPDVEGLTRQVGWMGQSSRKKTIPCSQAEKYSRTNRFIWQMPGGIDVAG